MKTNHHTSAAAQIRNLLIVFGSAIAMAALLALVSLHYYNPTGSYLAKNVLLTPESLASMRFADGTTKAGGTPRFVFDTIEFSFFDNILKKWSKQTVTLDQYANFYNLIKNEKSFVEVTEETEKAFHTAYPASLVLKVRSEGSPSWQAPASAMTEVDFAAEGDYYRIQLRQQNGNQSWAYFQQPGIYKKVHELFGNTP